MSEHPIENLMMTAMNSIKDMVDVNTIIGEPIETNSNVVIIPISKVCFGFAAGGSEFSSETLNEYNKKETEEAIQYRLPFGGGSGAGVNISPIAFLVVEPNNVKLLPVSHTSSMDRLLDYVPDFMEKLNSYITKAIDSKKEEIKEQNKENGIKENLDKVNQKVQNLAKTKPKRTKSIKPVYEFEYDEIEVYDKKDEESI